MTDLALRPASELPSEEMAALFNLCYSDYYAPVQVNPGSLERMIRGYDIRLEASRLGMLGGQPVAFAFLGVRGERGWIGGMGVVPGARGNGFGLALMRAALDSARGNGVTSVDLEVLEQNAHAIPIYERLGFRDRRWLGVWARLPGAARPDSATSPVRALAVSDCLAQFDRLHPEPSPWQRDLPTLRHFQEGLAALGTVGPRGISGCVIHRTHGPRVEILDVALEGAWEVACVESALRSLLEAHPDSALSLVNLPADHPAAPPLAGVGATVRFLQREMTLDL